MVVQARFRPLEGVTSVIVFHMYSALFFFSPTLGTAATAA